jgi:RND family efflux transporter MFP subunit
VEVVVAPLVAKTAATLVLLSGMGGVVGGCGRGNTYVPPPPPEVTVSHPVEREVTTYSEFTGHTVGIETVDIRARVAGYLQSVNFTPGARVKKGDLLFVIEPAAYQAAVDQAKADLEGREAEARAAQQQLEITQAIFARSAGSRTDVVTKTQTRDLAVAAVARAKATLEAATLNLSYTHIYAPISGRIDRNRVDVGNLVGTADATLLATIVDDGSIYVYFTASERELLEYRKLQQEKRTAAVAGQRNVAYLGLATDQGFPYVGEVDFASNRVDPDTGTIEIRAIFPNPDAAVLAGLFARVRLPLTREQALVVPEAALSNDQGGPFLLLVDANNKVEHRPVKTGPEVEGQMRVILGGVTPADWVVVKGLQRARPGSEVKPTQAEIPPAPSSSSPGDQTRP